MRPERDALRELSGQPFDMLVVGGGITGSAIARDAAMRGLRVALVDKGDFGSGTSSRSSRLIHGGVRYLEHGHFHLVFEASAERRRLLNIAPHLVRPLAFTWPVYRGQRLPLWKLSAGLALYDALALFRNVARHRRLDPAGVLAVEPRLAARELRGGVHYFDASTNDARLTLANALGARDAGATVANHVALVSACAPGTGARVFRIEDALTGARAEVRARVLVNAAGPWSDDVRHRLGADGRRRVRGSKGSHVAVDRRRVGNSHAVTLTHPRDGRVMFVLPAGDQCIVGTTDIFTDESPDSVRASEPEVAYLLEGVNAFFPDARLDRGDVVSAWSGIRPLVPARGSSVAASREHAITQVDGVVTITGGKLTTYRVMAADVVNAALETLGRRKGKSPTRDRPLPGATPDVAGAIADATCLTGDPGVATHMVHAYGDSWREVHERCVRDARSGERLLDGSAVRMGEMAWCVERELACTLGDLLIRRAPVAFQMRDAGRSVARRVAAYLGWPDTETLRYDEETARIFSVTP